MTLHVRLEPASTTTAARTKKGTRVRCFHILAVESKEEVLNDLVNISSVFIAQFRIKDWDD